MENSFSLSSSCEVIHGDHFSVFADGSDFYWVVSNDFPSVFKGPFDLRTAKTLFFILTNFVHFSL